MVKFILIPKEGKERRALLTLNSKLYLLTQKLVSTHKIAFFFILTVFLIFSCRRKDISEDDKALVIQFLADNRSTLTGYQFLEGVEKSFIYSLPLFPSDTVYQNKNPLEKIAQTLSFFRLSTDTFHFDSLKFIIAPTAKETLCEIIYLDSMRHCIAIIKYDSLWQISFVDTQKVDTIRKIGFLSPKESEKIYPLVAKKSLRLKKVSGEYVFYRVSGGNAYYPHIDSIPKLDFISLESGNQSLRIDSPEYFLTAHQLDSLFTISKGETLKLKVYAKIPADTLNEKYLLFVHNREGRHFINKDSFSGEIEMRIEGAGLTFITLELISTSSLYYPHRRFYYNLFQIPLLVK